MGERLKRAMDVAVALAAAPVAAPLLVAAALGICLESPGNPVFTQTRVGRGGRRFRLFKLRTMVVGAERMGAGLYNEKDDPRFLKLGTLLRRWSVDELPQLANVLLGDMSVVGPRPMVPQVVEQYADDYREILQVKPGLTGLVQISGRNELPRSRRLELDREYARTWSMLGDARILLKTVSVVLGGEGQRNDQGAADVER